MGRNVRGFNQTGMAPTALASWGAESGIIFNPDKVTIGHGKNTIKAFGFRLDESGIHPTDEMKAAVQGFEVPLTLKSMRVNG